jgi:hypothetical protein
VAKIALKIVFKLKGFSHKIFTSSAREARRQKPPRKTTPSLLVKTQLFLVGQSGRALPHFSQHPKKAMAPKIVGTFSQLHP